MFSARYPYLPLLFSHFVFLFSLSFYFSSRHETHSTIYNVCDSISFQPVRNITEIENTSQSTTKEKVSR